MLVRYIDGRDRGELKEVPYEVARTLIDRGTAVDWRLLVKVEMLSGKQAGCVVEVSTETGERLLRAGTARRAADDAEAIPYDGPPLRADGPARANAGDPTPPDDDADGEGDDRKKAEPKKGDKDKDAGGKPQSPTPAPAPQPVPAQPVRVPQPHPAATPHPHPTPAEKDEGKPGVKGKDAPKDPPRQHGK